MFAIITNTHTNESKFINLLEWCSGLNPNQITLEKAADKIIKRISATYPKAYKHISTMKIISLLWQGTSSNAYLKSVQLKN